MRLEAPPQPFFKRKLFLPGSGLKAHLIAPARGCFYKLGVPFVGVLIIGVLLCGVSTTTWGPVCGCPWKRSPTIWGCFCWSLIFGHLPCSMYYMPYTIYYIPYWGPYIPANIYSISYIDYIPYSGPLIIGTSPMFRLTCQSEPGSC